MKSFPKLLILLLLFSISSNAQVTEINAKDGTLHYISNAINYPISGIYLFEGLTEPIVQLNSDGTGIYQLHNQPKNNIIWGLECDEYGKTIFVKGFNSAVYTLWYQKTTSPEELVTNELNEDGLDVDQLISNNWTNVQFSIHFNKKKMYIQGERIKSYDDSKK